MPPSESNIALLIDADNAPASKIEAILAEVAKYGVANIRRAYGNWTSPNLKGWEEHLHGCAIRPIQQFDLTKGKNATDAALIIDAMDLLYTQTLDGFALVSSDCDFTPLVMRILTSGVKVYGFGEAKTPKPFVYACSKFLYLENLGQGSSLHSTEAGESDKKSSKDLRQDTKLVNLLRRAVDTAQDDDGWSNLAAVGSHIANQASFDSRNYGYSKLSTLFDVIGLFEMERRENGAHYVRDKRTHRSSKG